MNSMSPLYSLARKFYRSLPNSLRLFANPLASWYGTLRQLRPEVWCIHGEERSTRLALTIYLSVVTPEYKSYLLELIFGSSFQAQYLGRSWLWNISQKVREAKTCHSVLLAEVHQPHLKFFGARDGIVIPAWVSGEADIPLDPASVRRNSIQSDRRRIRNHGLEFEITRDPKRFEEYYYKMYVPYIKKAHGNGSFLKTETALKAQFKTGDLLLIKKQHEYIAGILLTYDDGCPYLRSIGVRDGNRSFINDGAIAAAYQFAFEYLQEKGHKKVRLGRSRAFLHDGVLRYKKKWSQRIAGGSTHKFALQVLSDADGTRAFLRSNPFIFERGNKLCGAVFESEVPPTLQSLQKAYNQYFHPGLSELILFSPPNGRAIDNLQDELPKPVVYMTDAVGRRFHYHQLPEAECADFSARFGCAVVGLALYPDSDTQT